MTHFVYPYVVPKNPVFGWELMFSLRSLEANFQGEFDITIIGECPSWIDPDIDNNLYFIPNNTDGLDAKDAKINSHYLIAARKYNDFIVIHDDMYMVNKCSKKELIIPKVIEADIAYTFNKDEDERLDDFQKIIRKTWLALKEAGYQYDINFVGHCPFYINSSKFLEMNNIFDLRNGFTTENLYMNYCGISLEETMAIKDFRSGHYSIDDHELNSTAKILSHDEIGYIYQPWIINLLYKLFPNQSKYEKKR